MSYGTLQIEKMTTESGYSLGAGNASSFKNRIINGGMTISQRNGTSVYVPVANGDYNLDRYFLQANDVTKLRVQQINSGAPAGFNSYAAVTVNSAVTVGGSDYYNFCTSVEGYNMADLAWGTASAKSVTLSFQVYSNVTGTFGGSIQAQGQSRSYPFTYTVSSANTWTPVSITIPGDTSGTWYTDNRVGLYVKFSLGAGAYLGSPNSWSGSLYLGATGETSIMASTSNYWYITGVQLEVGTVATSFDFRSYGTELALCQRYFNMVANYDQNGGNAAIGMSVMVASTDMRSIYNFPVQMRAAPSIIASNTSQAFRIYNGGNFYLTTLSTDFSSKNGISMVSGGGLSGATQGQGGILFAQQAGAYFSLSSEL